MSHYKDFECAGFKDQSHPLNFLIKRNIIKTTATVNIGSSHCGRTEYSEIS